MTPIRTEFGFTRTECACEQCVACCENLPAYLVPSDIEAIAAHLGYDNTVQYGCGFFHYGMSQHEADLRSSRGLQAIAREWVVGGLYARIWMLLHTAGLVAPCPIEARSRLRKAIASRQPRKFEDSSHPSVQQEM